MEPPLTEPPAERYDCWSNGSVTDQGSVRLMSKLTLETRPANHRWVYTACTCTEGGHERRGETAQAPEARSAEDRFRQAVLRSDLGAGSDRPGAGSAHAG